jgi:hypothetical protein
MTCNPCRVPAKRDFAAELNVVSVKNFTPVTQHPLNTELKREVAPSAKTAVVTVKKPVIVSKGKNPLDDPLSVFGSSNFDFLFLCSYSSSMFVFFSFKICISVVCCFGSAQRIRLWCCVKL